MASGPAGLHRPGDAVSTWIPGEDQAERIKTLYLTQARIERCSCGGTITAAAQDERSIVDAVRRHQLAKRHRLWSLEQGFR